MVRNIGLLWNAVHKRWYISWNHANWSSISQSLLVSNARRILIHEFAPTSNVSFLTLSKKISQIIWFTWKYCLKFSTTCRPNIFVSLDSFSTLILKILWLICATCYRRVEYFKGHAICEQCKCDFVWKSMMWRWW